MNRWNFSNPYIVLFLLWAVALLFSMPYLSCDAGITEDEPQHMEHGQTLLNWYLGTDSTASVSPFDSTGTWRYVTEGNGSKPAMNAYGGFFDLLAATVHHFLCPNTNEFTAKHALSAVFGALLFVFTALVVQVITGSWSAALFSLVIVTFTPRLFGYSLSNPKDIPLATVFALGIWQIAVFVKQLPKVRVLNAVLLALSFAMAVAIRSGAVILIFYYIGFTALYLWWKMKLEEIALTKAVKIFGITLLISIVGYLCTSLFWPWAMNNPLLNPIRSISVFSNFNNFYISEVFEGKWLTHNIPWYYVPKWLYITLPLTVIIGFALFFVMLPKFMKRRKKDLVLFALLLFSIVFPIASIVYKHSNIYNAARHVSFIVPSILVLASLGWWQVFKNIDTRIMRWWLCVVIALLLYEPVMFIYNNHPLQGLYFSPAIGGMKGGFKNYEMDFWGYSVKSAVNWLEKNDSIGTPEKKARVRFWYGEQKKLSLLIANSQRLQYVATEENSANWDYFIELQASAKYANDILYHWPPKGTIYEVMVDGVSVCAIIKNWRVPTSINDQAALVANLPTNTAEGLINSGFAYYNKKDFNRAIVEFKKALVLSPKNTLVYNNIVATFNNMQMFDEALEYGAKGLQIDPQFQLLKNNLSETAKAKAQLQPNENYFVNLSYNYYTQQEWEKCIAASKKILKYNPKNPIAYNNICSAYNQLHQFEKALEACGKGLQLAPDNELLKNNKAEAEKSIVK